MTTAHTIRPEHAVDLAPIDEVLRTTFAGDDEAKLVRALRHDGDLTLSLVMLVAQRVVGHIG